MVTLDELARGVEELGPLPMAAGQLAQVMQNPGANLKEVVGAIRYDQALTATILRHANSAASSPATRVVTVRDALIRLGTGKVLGLALALWVRSPMSQPLPAYGFGEAELWRHSAAAALATEALCERTSMALPTLTFTTALIHDLGKLILARHLRAEQLEAISRRVIPGQTTFEEAEQQVLGFGHSRLGAAIAARWNLAPEIARAVGNHHQAEAAEDPVCAAVQTCNAIAKTVGCGVGYEGMVLVTLHPALKRLGICQTAFERLCAEVAGHLPQIERGFG